MKVFFTASKRILSKYKFSEKPNAFYSVCAACGGMGVTMRIRDLREDSDLTQREIAEYLHIRQNTYSQYENGQRQLPIDVLIALAKYYHTSTDYLLGLTDQREPYK